MPSGGAADQLSMALANRLLDQPGDTPLLEITLSGAGFHFNAPTRFAVTGGQCAVHHDGHPVGMHEATFAPAGSELIIASKNEGARIYLAIEGGLAASDWLSSKSTCLVTKSGGHDGRPLQTGDLIGYAGAPSPQALGSDQLETPKILRPHMGRSWMLRAVPGPEFDHLTPADQTRFFSGRFTVSARASRIGAELDGPRFDMPQNGKMASAAVFPGTVQCPPEGKPFLLMCDAGTTGGYPRLANIIRADRHMLGQIKPGDHVQIKRTDPDTAAQVLREKTALLRRWLGDTFELR